MGQKWPARFSPNSLVPWGNCWSEAKTASHPSFPAQVMSRETSLSMCWLYKKSNSLDWLPFLFARIPHKMAKHLWKAECKKTNHSKTKKPSTWSVRSVTFLKCQVMPKKWTSKQPQGSFPQPTFIKVMICLLMIFQKASPFLEVFSFLGSIYSFRDVYKWSFVFLISWIVLVGGICYKGSILRTFEDAPLKMFTWTLKMMAF